MVLKYYIFCVKWLWRNRDWKSTRQKFKAMEKAWSEEGLKWRRLKTGRV